MTQNECEELCKKLKEVITEDCNFSLFIVDSSNEVYELGYGCPGCMREIIEENFKLKSRGNIGGENGKVH